MFFSVIVPVYNVEKYMKECLDSLTCQSFADYEVILVDDGSTDESGSICDEYSKEYSYVHVLHQKNAGQASARNAGLKVSTGKYIVYLDSDDYIGDHNFLSKLYEKCQNDTDIVLYGYKKYYESNQSMGNPICQYPDVKGLGEPSKIIRALLEVDMYDGSAWNKTIKADLLKSNHIEFPVGVISEDSDWYLQVILHAKSYDAIHEAFVVYRQRATSTSHAPKIKSLTDNIDMLERWMARLEEMKLTEDMKTAFVSVLARYYGNILILFTLFSYKDVKEYYQRMKKLSALLKYSTTKRTKIIKGVSDLFGLRFTMAVLSIAGKLRRRM